MLRRAFILSLVAFTSACAVPNGQLALAPNSTLIVVRHSDRDGENLNAKGIERSKALVKALDGMPLDAIYSPGIKRNLDTAAPLSKARALPVQRQAQENPTPALVSASAGQTVIWIGNKGNIAAIWEDLRLSDPAPLDYGDLHIIRSDSAGAVTIERRRFGP
ncbi:hypothetical protein TRP8649_01563 [Pelagimonas phthalicica]|uniref:Histidine phosphatase superfamily (Branch 1) n=1 Tax=Pelagimonas phthalicica TaxID=1037362 RepID=A0A238J9W8_9RHOB|nr:histidine phosphatase family protein [Pelagimonas phthalicica]TDS94017.1 histidine phosphatase superfamily protein (branch 1) [Pelagimonas phthalicica]SMX27458.1 hypothetical protein TRP8649_01563 [Pelagimonas phthalicica]